MLGMRLINLWLQKYLVLEAHVGGVVEGFRVLGTWLPSRWSLDLHNTSFPSTGALDVGNISVIQDKIGSVFTTPITWAGHSTVECLVGMFEPLFSLLHHSSSPPSLGLSSSTTASPPLQAVSVNCQQSRTDGQVETTAGHRSKQSRTCIKFHVVDIFKTWKPRK